MSPTGYARHGGTWVQSGLTGKARFGGADVTFAPPSGGFVDEAFTFPTPPTLPNNDDGARVHLATRFALTSGSGSWIGVQVYTPSVSLPDMYGLAFDDDTDSELARVQVLTPAVGTLVDFLFDTPIAVTTGVNYLAAYSSVRYAATGSGGVSWPYTTTHMSTDPGAASRFTIGGAVGSVPATSSSAAYHVSPIIRFAA
jgi:hypothetical protein